MQIPENPFQLSEGVLPNDLYVLLNKTDFLQDIFKNIYFDASCNQFFNDMALFARQFGSIEPKQYVMDINLIDGIGKITLDKMKAYVMLKVKNPFVRQKAIENIHYLAVPVSNAILSPIDYVVDKICYSVRCHNRLVALSDTDASEEIKQAIKYAFSTIGIDYEPEIKITHYKEFTL